MERRQLKILIGVAMIGLGIIQAGLYARQGEWLPIGFGLLYSVIGIVYLWIEVYAIDQ